MAINLNIQRHSFQPGAMSIIQMGEELIGHPSTAINELVKNGYDADALNCKVYFHHSKNPTESFAFVFDNGSGMDDNTLFGDWLKPSVSSKRRANAKSKTFKRHLLGSKGIGRLAAMALGESVTVISKKEKRNLYNWITINRESFRRDKLLSEVYFPGDSIDVFDKLFKDEKYYSERSCFKNESLLRVLNMVSLNDFNNGTLIVIERLDSSVLKIIAEDFNQTEIFNEPSIKGTSFYKSLSALITPLRINSDIQAELLDKEIIHKENLISTKDSAFSVEFGINLIPNQGANEVDWQEIEPIPVQSVYDFRAYGKVNSKGDLKGFLDYKRLIKYSYEETLEIPFSEIINESINGKDLSLEMFSDQKKQVNETGEYYFDIRIYDIGEKDNLEKLALEAGFESGMKFRTAFKDFQGLRISKNGFGVKPYGEEVEDWIGLSKARVQNPGQNVNTNQILGYVFFYSPENDILEEKTNREGFLENRAFMQVKSTMSVLFKNIGRKRYNYRLLHGIGRVPSSRHTRPDIEEFRSVLNSNNISQIRNYSEKFLKDVTTSMDNLEDSLSFAERLASLGGSVELIYHEMAQPISALRNTKSSLNFKKERIDAEIADSFLNDIDTLHHSTDIIAELRSSLQPAIGRTRKKKFKPRDTFFKVLNLFKNDIFDNKIEIIFDKELDDYEIVDLEYAFWISFLNIVNNAVYWIKKAGRGGEIRFLLEGDSLVVSNSGPFINDDILDLIFSYGVTTRQEKNATGLGLAFTQSVLSRNNWAVSAINRDNGPAFIIKKLENE
ncbi:sensor histidine kinase [Pedobacter steynii]|uniref:Histidine kinase domain-containing protein n=1 Tax=Pedobacter steynii TaxID=430522 RepID=A0A1D7QKL7_9SPHI|nr:sensor histidine kinase [Pedobacter steynii]AOM79190.1 hypothetical protein BFS30_19675 [Pedobacter steynii]